MWNRKELKARGKVAFKANYWKCVLVALIIIAITGGAAGAGASTGADNANDSGQGTVVEQYAGGSITMTADESTAQFINDLKDEEPAVIKAVAAIILGVSAIAVVVGLVLNIFVINPLLAGCYSFFRRNSHEKAPLGEMGAGFRNGYGRVVKTMLLMDIFLILWYCLLIIPGIIKTYSYRMVPYIVAERDDLTAKEAITLSRQMMDGNKWKAFVLDLSFILWWILTAITLGIVGIFYVNPYYQATNAELYHALKAEQAPQF